MNGLRVSSAILTAIAMSASFAHLLALPNEIGLPADDYLVVQQIYRGWALPGIVIAGAMATAAARAIAGRRNPREFRLTLLTAALLATSLVVFLLFTFPFPRTRRRGTGPFSRPTGRPCGARGSTPTPSTRSSICWH